jgi:rhomboid protease GluP
MFAQFSARLYENAAREDYKLATTNGAEFSEATHWAAEKTEMATIVLLNVMDAAKIDFEKIKSYDKKIRENAVGQQITSVYILAGGEVPVFEEIEEYFGQRVYSIFWHVNLQTGEIFVPKGQPKKFFNLREMILSSYNEMHADENSGETFTAVSTRAHELRPKAKYRHPIICYAIILFNAAILGLMYLDGYLADNILVAVRFGAIRSDLILQNNEWHRLFAAMFLHFGFAHLFANTFGILIFGTRLERYLGRRMFCAVYIFSGLVGSVFSLVNLSLFHPHVVSAGASGAVYGVIGAIFAYTRITKRSIEFINWYLMLIYITMGIGMGFATPGIDNFAHLGGLLCGVLIGGVYARKIKK